jgi:hypothetical protein
MMEYISSYYVTPDPGCLRASEQKLEQQRALTLSKLASAAQTFTGQKLGTNIPAWTLWKQQKQPKPLTNSQSPPM